MEAQKLPTAIKTITKKAIKNNRLKGFDFEEKLLQFAKENRISLVKARVFIHNNLNT